jgi:Xaa-Pro aminopeptidase
MQKTQGEISKMKKAAEISDMTFEKMLGFIKPGMTELEVSAEITYTQKKLGASKDAFEPIIASGWRGALPHGIASDKKIENGEMITLDFGCIYEGFCSDLTRTISVGKPVTEMKKIYDIVYEVQNKTVERVKAGMSSMKLDSEARNEIAAKGYGEHFGHGLGHGLGIEVHERPSVGQRDDVILAENSVITIEPGIYIEGLGGVRIEDDVLLKADSNEVLNKAKKELIII